MSYTEREGLHCVYDKCRGFPYGPGLCSPGCSFTMKALNPVFKVGPTSAPPSSEVEVLRRRVAELEQELAAQRDSAYSDAVRAGKAAGWNRQPFPPDEPIGSAFAHGWRLGHNERKNADRIEWLQNKT